MAFSGEARAISAEKLLDPVKAIVECVAEMSRSAADITASNRSVVDHHNRPTRAGEKIGGSETGDAGADDANRGPQVLFQTRHLGRITSGHPH